MKRQKKNKLAKEKEAEEKKKALRQKSQTGDYCRCQVCCSHAVPIDLAILFLSARLSLSISH